MDKKHIAAQLYTVREFTQTPEDFKKTIEKLKGIGYEAVQVSAIGPIDPLLLKQIVDGNGIRICATHLSYDRLKNDIGNVISEHKLWNCKYVGLGCMPAEFRNSREGYLAFADEFSEIGKRLADNGLKFIYHNHRFEFEKFDGISGMDILLENTDPEIFGFELDTYWIQAGGANPVDWIKKVRGRMDVVHFKDMAIIDNQQVFAEIGEGNLNWEEIIQACRDIGVEWYAIEQDICRRDPFESLEKSFKYLNRFTC